MNNMNISVVIPTKNRIEDIIRTIESLSSQYVKPSEIIIVDDSDNEFYEKLDIYLHNIFGIKIYHFIGKKESANSARNLGLKKVKQDAVLFLDDDVILDEEYIKAILEVYSKYSSVGGVGGVIQNYRKLSFLKRLFKSIFFLDNSEKNGGYLLLSGYPCHLESCDQTVEVELFSGCNMSYRTEIFKEFQFDEDLKGYSYLDDVDFSYRVSKKYKLFITPKAKLIHNSKSKLFDEKLVRVKVYYHYLISKKVLPKSTKTIVVFTISLVGDFLQSIIISIINRTNKPFIGFLKGLNEILNHIRVRL